MLESPEQIQGALELAGEDITFPVLTSTVDNVTTILREEFTIKAIPGKTVYNVQDYSSPADLQAKDITFRCSSFDYITKGVKHGNLFSYTPSNTLYRTFTFKILSSFDDFTGWVTMNVALQEVTSNVV